MTVLLMVTDKNIYFKQGHFFPNQQVFFRFFSLFFKRTYAAFKFNHYIFQPVQILICMIHFFFCFLFTGTEFNNSSSFIK